MRLLACKRCKSASIVLFVLVIVIGTAFHADFKTQVELDEELRQQAWNKVNEAHELWKMKDLSEGKLLQHLHPSLLQKQLDLHAELH